jgi:hypothetical protein
MTRLSSIRPLVVILLLAGLLAACTPTPAPVTPTATPPPTATPLPVTPTPAGWVQHQTADLTIWLPDTWEVLEVTQADLESIYADFQKNNPELATVIGSAEALKGVSLWAFNTASKSPGFTDNLNIRRTPLGGQQVTDMQKEILDPVLAQYKQLGFNVSDSKGDLKIGDQPAARIAYTFEMAGGDGQPMKAEGQQYVVATATDLWILSFTAGPGQSAALAPVIEQIAQSFRAK